MDTVKRILYIWMFLVLTDSLQKGLQQESVYSELLTQIFFKFHNERNEISDSGTYITCIILVAHKPC